MTAMAAKEDRLADLNQSREQAEQQLRAIQAELARLAEPTPTHTLLARGAIYPGPFKEPLRQPSSVETACTITVS